MGRTFKIGDKVWHGFRYWKTDGLGVDEVLGWNTEYIPYSIVQITAKRIKIDNTVIGEVFQLNRQVMERDGKQYHSRVHEYIYAEKPPFGGDNWNWAGSNPMFSGDPFGVLGLPFPCSRADVRRAYKRLALKTHPDLGGSNQAFIKLKEAHDSALRFAYQ